MTTRTEPRIGSPEAKARKRPSGTGSLLEPAIVKRALRDSITKLDPRLMVRNPVMFVVEIGSALTTILFLRDIGSSSSADNVFAGLVAAWLWFTVLFANFAEAVAEGRGQGPGGHASGGTDRHRRPRPHGGRRHRGTTEFPPRDR